MAAKAFPKGAAKFLPVVWLFPPAFRASLRLVYPLQTVVPAAPVALAMAFLPAEVPGLPLDPIGPEEE